MRNVYYILQHVNHLGAKAYIEMDSRRKSRSSVWRSSKSNPHFRLAVNSWSDDPSGHEPKKISETFSKGRKREEM